MRQDLWFLVRVMASMAFGLWLAKVLGLTL